MDSKQRSASALGFFGRFRLGSLMWLCLLAAVLLMWHRDRTGLQLQIASLSGYNRTAWSIDQLLGQPNTSAFGDIATAWASQMPDAGMEWVIVEFPYTVKATGVDIYETYNPGAIMRIATVSMTGSEQVVWEGTDPVVASPSPPTGSSSTAATPAVSGLTFMSAYAAFGPANGGISKIRFSSPISTRRLKIFIDSAKFPGWNEIDAVALLDSNSKPQWASNAWASSSFGSNRKVPAWFYP